MWNFKSRITVGFNKNIDILFRYTFIFIGTQHEYLMANRNTKSMNEDGH